jgi:hypothetical protein
MIISMTRNISALRVDLHVVPKYYDSHRDGHVSKLSLTSY